MTNKKFFSLVIVSTLLYIMFYRNLNSYLPLEQLDIPSGVGYDLILDKYGIYEYSVPIVVYGYGEGQKITSIIHTGEAKTLGKTRVDRQLKSNKKFIIGHEKVSIYSEDFARYGIKNAINILLSNPSVNDTAIVAVCKGNALDIFNHHTDNYPSEPDYIEGMIKYGESLYFSDSKFKMMDVFHEMQSEGQNIQVPYIEIVNNKLKLTGAAVFKYDKMKVKLNEYDTKIMNILRNNNVRGIISIESDKFGKYADFYATSKRKVRCIMKDNCKFTFYININLDGSIISNSIYSDIRNNPMEMQKLKKDLQNKITESCNTFINKMKNQYKVDCINLGQYAVAKFGRNKNIDWDEVVCNSDININVNVDINKKIRGD